MAKAREQCERERQRAKSAAGRAAERDIALRPVGNPDRRAECEADDALWLRTYLPGVFYNPFTVDQLGIIRDVGEALRFGTSKCIAAPRWDGKSSICRYLLLKYALARQICFGVIVCATGPKADESLRAIKANLRRKRTPLWQDYPLECDVAAYVAPAPARANNATVDGRRIHVEWSQNRLILPSFIDTDPVAPIVVAHGWESEQLQGLNVFDIRPDFILLDDLDNRGSLAAADGVIAGKIETIIDTVVAGLGGPGRRLGQTMLCTITSRRSAAFKYSDPKQKPAWSGVRLQRVKQWPERTDLWDTYIELRQAGKGEPADGDKSAARDPHGREAFRFYADNRAEMDRGALLSNPHDYICDVLPDGTPTHLSALQKCYDYIADHGLESFLPEHQNDPPQPAEEMQKAGISRRLVESRLSGFERGELPPESAIVIGVDVHKHMHFWAAVAFRPGGVANIVQYDRIETNAEDASQQQVVERAILRSLLAWREELTAHPFPNTDGDPVEPSAVLIDSGYCPDAVGEFLKRVGGVYRATKGIPGSRFYHGTPSRERRVGNHWFATLQPDKSWLFCLDVDHWKRQVHERFIAEPFDKNNRPNPGSLTLFVPKGARDHGTFSAHILAEEWVVEFQPGKGERARWIKNSQNNHLLDCAALCLAGGEMIGRGIFAPAATNGQAAPRSPIMSTGPHFQPRW